MCVSNRPQDEVVRAEGQILREREDVIGPVQVVIGVPFCAIPDHVQPRHLVLMPKQFPCGKAARAVFDVELHFRARGIRHGEKVGELDHDGSGDLGRGPSEAIACTYGEESIQRTTKVW